VRVGDPDELGAFELDLRRRAVDADDRLDLGILLELLREAAAPVGRQPGEKDPPTRAHGPPSDGFRAPHAAAWTHASVLDVPEARLRTPRGPSRGRATPGRTAVGGTASAFLAKPDRAPLGEHVDEVLLDARAHLVGDGLDEALVLPRRVAQVVGADRVQEADEELRRQEAEHPEQAAVREG